MIFWTKHGIIFDVILIDVLCEVLRKAIIIDHFFQGNAPSGRYVPIVIMTDVPGRSVVLDIERELAHYLKEIENNSMSIHQRP